MRWHPTLAGVFVSVLSSGRAELWDVCHSLLEPVTVFVKEGIVCSCFDCLYAHLPIISAHHILTVSCSYSSSNTRVPSAAALTWRPAERLVNMLDMRLTRDAWMTAGGAPLTAAAFSANKRSPVLAIASEDGTVALVALSGLPTRSNSYDEIYAALGIKAAKTP